MKKMFPLIFILILLVLPILQVNIVSGGDSSILQIDDSEFGGYMDVKKVMMYDNQTHLFIDIVFDGDLPQTTDSMTYYHSVAIYIDIDNNFFSGLYLSQSIGADIIIFIVFSSNFKWGGLYNLAGQWQIYDIASWYTYNSSSVSLVIPIDELEGFVGGLGNSFRIVRFYAGTYINDYFVAPSYKNLVDLSINKKDVIVDGDPSDWTGINPSIIDQGYESSQQYSFINATALYTALSVDGSKLQHLINVTGISNIDNYMKYPDYELWNRFSASIDYDTDMDGVEEINIGYGLDYCIVENLTTGSYIFIYPADGYSFSFREGWAEISIPSEWPGIYKIPSGTIGIGGVVHKWFFDYVIRASGDMVLYKFGEGGYVLHSTRSQDTNLDNQVDGIYSVSVGENYVYLDELHIKFNATSVMPLVLRNYYKDPCGTDFKSVSKFYFLYFRNPSYITWPIEINISYDPGILKTLGVDESELVPFYFDRSRGEYVPFSDYKVDVANNVVYITMYEDEYLNSDCTIVLGYIPKPKNKYVFIGISGRGLARLSVNLDDGTGKLMVYMPVKNTWLSYKLVFESREAVGDFIIVKGYIAIQMPEREYYLPITLTIDKQRNTAYLIGPIPFFSLSTG